MISRVMRNNASRSCSVQHQGKPLKCQHLSIELCILPPKKVLNPKSTSLMRRSPHAHQYQQPADVRTAGPGFELCYGCTNRFWLLWHCLALLNPKVATTASRLLRLLLLQILSLDQVQAEPTCRQAIVTASSNHISNVDRIVHRTSAEHATLDRLLCSRVLEVSLQGLTLDPEELREKSGSYC